MLPEYRGHLNSKHNLLMTDITINNNTNNNIVAADGGGNATLAVTKTVTCIPNDNFGPAAEACQFILSNAPPSSFNIVITGNNPNPPEFLGSSVPVVVTLGAGDYEITEEVPIVSFPDGASITLTTNFAGDCRDVNPNNPQSTEATGTIQAGESQICDISNDYRTATLP